MIFSRVWYEIQIAPLVVQIALIFIFTAAVVTILAYFIILFRRLSGYLAERRRARLHPIIDDVITDQIIFNENYLVEGPENAVHLNFDKLKKSPFTSRRNRQILIDHLMRYRKNMRGINGDLLKYIYLDLQLQKESLEKLKSNRWNNKVQALQELTTMEIAIPDVNILPLTNSKNRELRSAARTAYLKLSKNEAFKFFDVVTEPMLEWDQIELFRIITSSENIVIPNFANWITYSTNKTIISFCMKLAVHYKQTNAADALMRLLNSLDHKLRAEAINSLGKLKIIEAQDMLLGMYSSQPFNCQLEILKALGRIESEKAFDFLKNEFMLAANFEIRKNAAHSLVKSRGITKEQIESLIDAVGPENLRILNHCMNPHIRF